jgi:hypothetical protein
VSRIVRKVLKDVVLEDVVSVALACGVTVELCHVTDTDARASPVWNVPDPAVTGTTTCWGRLVHL